MSQPLVSVIIPNYNHARFLEQRIESVLNQTFQDFEVILLDDKSTDNSVEILEKYRGHPKVTHLVVNKENSGKQFMQKQWKLGLSLAVGKYIWIAESDDWAELTFLEEMVPCFAKGENIGLVHCDSFVIKKNKIETEHKFIKREIFGVNRWDTDFFEKGKVHLIKYYGKGLTINNISSALFDKQVLSNTLNKKIDIDIPIDFLICADVLISKNIFYNSICLNNYRVYDDSTSLVAYVDERYYVESFKEKLFFMRAIKKNNIDKSLVTRTIGSLFYLFYNKNYSYKLIPKLFMVSPILAARLVYDILKKKITKTEIHSSYK